MKVIGYVRVSTDKQGLSLDAQTEKLEAYARLYDLELVQTIVDDGLSAKSLQRPGLQRALAMLKTGKAEGLLIAKLDRLTRSVKDLATLLDDYFVKKFTLLSVSDQIDTRTAAGELVLNILVAVGQWERKAIGERTKAVMQHMRSQGQYTGGKPRWGFRLEGDSYIPVAEEQAILEAARASRAKGLSLRQVSAELAKAGHLTRSGRPFCAKQIAAFCLI